LSVAASSGGMMIKETNLDLLQQFSCVGLP
jgi:hypothetical protein